MDNVRLGLMGECKEEMNHDVYLLLPLGGNVGEHRVAAEEGDDSNHEEVSQGGEHVQVKPEHAEKPQNGCKV